MHNLDAIPKWARDRITLAESNLNHARSELQKLRGKATAGCRVIVDNYSDNHEQRPLLETDRVVFRLHRPGEDPAFGPEAEVYLAPDCTRLGGAFYPGICVRGSGRLIVTDEAPNVLQFAVERGPR